MSFCDWRGKSATAVRRRLAFELLERRELLAVMRIVDWNTLNNPNDAAGDAAFQTVLQAIGNETFAGNTQRVDILALQETDPPGIGDSSIERIQSVLNGLYAAANYEFVVSLAGTDSTGFVFDTTSVSLLESVEVGIGSLTHTSMRGKFRPADTFGESDFYLYSVHLKSGTSGADAGLRASEAAFLRADANALNEGANVLFVGDFNMKGSSELAWTNLSASGAAQLFDAANTPGDWFDDPAFKLYHSQDPRTTMDDRFDIHFGTGEVFDGIGFEYVPNSYHVFGNNGTHTFDMPITTGTGASVTVLNALVAASDHLPVIADYQVVVSAPKVRISETLGGTKVVEGGLYDTYQVVLDTVPSANVDVTVTPNAQVDIGNGAGVAKVFTFTPANALTPQTVVVKAANDLVGEGNHTASITHSSASSDAAYDALIINAVTVAIVDNDASTIVINELDADQAGTDTQEFIELYDGGVGNVSLSGYILVFYNGNDAMNRSYRTVDLSGKFTDANGFFFVADMGFVPAPGLEFTVSQNAIENGADGIGLVSAPASAFPNNTVPIAGDSRLRDAVVYDTDDADDTDLIAILTPGQPQLNENENGGNSFETESLSRRPDGGSPFNSSAYVTQTPTPGTFNQAQPIGVQFVQSVSRVDLEEGGVTDTYQIALQTIPSADVTITIDPDNQTNLGAGVGVATMLTFTPANALTPQTVTVTAVNDVAIEGVHTSTIAHTAASGDARYNGLAISNVVANIVDNDVAPPVSIVISEIMFNPGAEGGAASPEWIEIVNTGTAAVDLGGWRFDDEDASNWAAIPANTILNPNQIAVFFDSNFSNAAAFRTDWAVPSGALVVGIGWGSLANGPSPTNEILQLLDSINVERDVVNFDDASPWPAAADGPSIYLKNLAADNNAGANWARSTTVAKAVSPSGSTYSTSDVGSPGRVFLAGDYNLNGFVDAADFTLWRNTLGSTSILNADGSGPTVGTPNGIVDQADYTFWRSNFGAIGVPNGGLGSGAGAVEGASGVAAMAGESSTPSSGSSTSVASAGSRAFDAAFAVFGAVPHVASGVSGALKSFGSSPLPATLGAADPLLAILPQPSAAESGDDSFDAFTQSVSNASREADELFATSAFELFPTRLGARVG